MTSVPPDVQPGDLFCVQGGPITGPIVDVLERLDGADDEAADFQHTAVVTDVKPLTIVEALPAGAVEQSFHYYAHRIIWSTGVLHPTNRAGIVAEARSFIGVGYGWLDYAALALHHWHVDLPGLRSYIDSTRTMICSQLADKAWVLAGDPIFHDGRWPGYVKPSSIARLLLSLGAKPMGPTHETRRTIRLAKHGGLPQDTSWQTT